MKRINERTFYQIKRQLKPWARPYKVAQRNELHISTVLNIKGCRDFREYRQLVEAEHQPVQYSIKNEVFALHRRIYEKPNVAYVYPKNCKQAMAEINETI